MKNLTILRFFMALALVLSPLPASGQEIDTSLFKPSQIISVETSKKQLKVYYMEEPHTRTLHCECHFDKQKQVYPAICEGVESPPADTARKEILKWEHLMPLPAFAGNLKCWTQPACQNAGAGNDPGCCRVHSPKFKRMEADMHNLFPAIEVAGESPDTRFGGMAEYRFCRSSLPDAPREGARGEVARAYFYMSYQYKIPIPDDLEDTLRQWHLADPPDAWEEKRNTMIELDQGNRNPFIDHPELVERVRDF
ncbi:MAG: endonuclease [Nitrospinaceae bacterium]|nr:MAG: endonuclease [Nitrospinaceae bacterium]